jgi:DtxR family Mn-dependent transcriptional regulator
MEHAVSVATGNFLKTIYKFEQKESESTKPGLIAKELGITNAAATDMARKLANRRLINYRKYKYLGLTPAGEKMALEIIRKHRLWETFLHQVLGLSMHEIHREAEMLEHLTSDFLAEKINQFLGYPTTDPHGDPIPSKQGKVLSKEDSMTLSLAKPGREYEVCRLSGSDKEFFDFCHSSQLEVGSVLAVKEQYPKNRMTEIEVNNTRLLLNLELGNAIFVKQINDMKGKNR